MKEIYFDGKKANRICIKGRNVASIVLNGAEVWHKRTAYGKWRVSVHYNGYDRSYDAVWDNQNSRFIAVGGMSSDAGVLLCYANGSWQIEISFDIIQPGHHEEVSCSGSVSGAQDATTIGRIDTDRDDVYLVSATWSEN